MTETRPMTKLQTKNLVALALTLAVLGTAWACRRAGNAEEAPRQAAPVLVGPENVVVATADTIRTGPSISGTVDAERTATLRAEITAQVTAVMVEPRTPV